MIRTMATATLGLGIAGQAVEAVSRLHAEEHLKNQSSLRNTEAQRQLVELSAICRQEGWDGYGALPIEWTTFALAQQILDTLPLGCPVPSLSAEPDGHITMEWYRSPHRVLSVSVDPNGYLHFAGLYGTSKKYGTLTLFADAPVPTDIIRLLGDL